MAATTWSLTLPWAINPLKAKMEANSKAVLMMGEFRMRSKFAKNGPHLGPCKMVSYEQVQGCQQAYGRPCIHPVIES